MIDKKTLYNFFEGTASYEEEVQVRKWMEASGENQKQFMEERRLFDMTNLHAVSKEENEQKNSKKIDWQTAVNFSLKVAAILVLAISGTLLLKTLIPQSPGPTSYQTVHVPAGQRVKLILADSTVVWLNSNTRIQYPTLFSKNKREVELDGEAYFEVSKNQKKPFIVTTDKGDVKVTGTSFNVEAYSDRNVFETALMEGKVEVYSKKHPGKVVELNPEHKTVLKNGELHVEDILNYDDYLWRKGLIAFKNKTFKDILFQLEKYFNTKLILSDDFVSGHTYTGKFRQSDGIEYALKVLKKSINFHYERDDENQIIYITN